MPREQITYPSHDGLLLTDHGNVPWDQGDLVPEGAHLISQPETHVHWRQRLTSARVLVEITDEGASASWLEVEGELVVTAKHASPEQFVAELLPSIRGRQIVIRRHPKAASYLAAFRGAGFPANLQTGEILSSGVQLILTVPVEGLRHQLAAIEGRGEQGPQTTHTSIITDDLSRDELNKLIRTLRTARDRVFGRDA